MGEKKFQIKDIIYHLGEGYRIEGNTEGKYFTHVKPIDEAGRETLVWVNPASKQKQNLVEETAARIIICDESISISTELKKNKCFLVTKNPRAAFIRLVRELFTVKEFHRGVHPTAYVHENAVIHENTSIGPFSYVGKCFIGEGTIVMGHCHLYDQVRIGRNVTIHAGCILGADGFGYEKNEDKSLEKFPHIGGIVIEDDVEIGANTCIDRGTLGDTQIRKGAKIDNLVHIAHNTIIGRYSLIIAHSMVGGSTKIGDYSWISPGSIIRDGVNIGDNVIVGMGALVTKDIPDNEVWYGVPAKKKAINS